MFNQNRTHRPVMRMLASILTWALVAGQVMQPVYAVLTPLADVPIAAKVAAKPNIIYTLDDSGSMQLNYIPDFTVSTSAAVAMTVPTRVGTLAKATTANTAALFTGEYLNIVGANQPEYNGQFAITVTSGTTFTYTIAGAPVFPATGAITYTAGSAYCRSGNNTVGCTATVQGNNSFNSPPFFTGDFNRMMYNPLVTYYPPIKADGTPVTIAGVTDANGNMGTTVALYAGVQRDVYLQMFGAGVKDNLQTRVAVPLYCNTDWPVTAGANLAITDVGDAQGQYSPGTGAWCRINGTKYDVSAASGAPAVLDDYNYPYRSSSGATGAQYFYTTLANKALWCDKTSPYWPQVPTLTGCGVGTAVRGPTTVRTCVKNSNTMSCNPTPASRNYTPAVCKTDPAAKYCAPGTGSPPSGSNTPGTGSPPECVACNCNNDFLTLGVNGTCSPTSAFCNANYGVLGGNQAQCPDILGAITSCIGGTPSYTYASAGSASCSSLMWDPVAKASGVTTLLTDSNGAGVVCRHNNQTYAVTGLPTAGGLFTYPRTNLGDVAPANRNPPGPYNQLGQFTTQATSAGCPTVGTTVNIPRHYYTVDSVLFCDNRINVVDDPWRGFGTGVCQDKNDLTQFKNVKFGQFHRWDLYANGPIYNPATIFPSGRVWLAASPTPANSESVNYANWYAGYATRLNAAKTTSGAAFANLTAQGTDPIAYRVGFQNLGQELPPNGAAIAGDIIWVDVKDWDLTQRTGWYNALYGIKVSNFKTPTISAMLRIGNLVETGGAGGVDPAVNPLPAGALDPFAKDAANNPISCTNNYHILFTDGYTNQIAPTSTAGDQDGTMPALPPVPGVGVDQVVPTLGLGGPWPAPFKQGNPAVANTLADIATYYWARDLRPTLKDNVPSSSGACKDAINAPCPPAPFQDVDWTKDVAWWQHVNFSALSFGSDGVLDASDQKATLAAIKGGSQTWPDLTNPWNPTHPLGTGAGAVAVDDLWHATVMARGSFVYAKNPTEVAYGLAGILAGIQNQQKARSGAAIGGQVLDANNNVIFLPTIEPGWGGDLRKIEINPATGAFVNTWWLANVELAKQIQPAFAGDEPWLSAAKRRVVTLANPTAGGRIPGPGVPFQYASLFGAPQGPAMLNSLSSDVLRQKKMIAYLRGGSTYGTAPLVTIEGTRIGQFRQRPSAGYNPYPTALGAGLGDITNAQPLILGPPGSGYVDGTDPGYTSFRTAKALRNTAVVAAANDGMVHVFDAGPMPSAGPPPVGVSAGGGTELFGFIPRALFRGVAGTPATEDVTGIQALAYQDGGVPIYHHRMYVDSSPRAADVDFDNGQGSPNWHSIVVGGLGKGGNSYYALDLTDVSVPDETTAAAKVMWEWTNPDSDVVSGTKLINGGSPGYTFGRPVIVKVRETGYPTGRWVAIVTAGYNNLSGKGKVFFLDAKTGTLLSTIATSAGTTANPSGLAQIHGFVKDQTNQTVEQIYGADLLGNAWRIDISLADSYKTAPAVLFALLTDKFGVPQPVTTAPQIEIDLNNGIDRYVFFGTGRLLDTSDLTNPVIPQPQTMYAIRDGSLTAILPVGSLPILPRVTMTPTPADGVSPIIGGAPNGWYHDLPSDPANVLLGAQRIVVDPTSNVNVAAYIGTKIPDDPCLISLPAFLYARDYTTARSLLETGGGAIVPYFDFSSGGAIGYAFIARTQSDGSLSLGILVYSEDAKKTSPVDIKNPITGPGIRWSWRLLSGQ